MAIVFFIVAFSACRFLAKSLPFKPSAFFANVARLCTSRASRLRKRSWWSSRYPFRLRWSSMWSPWGIVKEREWWGGAGDGDGLECSSRRRRAAAGS